MKSATSLRSLYLATVFLTAPIAAHAAEASTPVDPVPKDFVAYLGLDVMVTDQGKDCPVVAYQDPQLSILHGSQPVRIPTSAARYKLSTEPKLGRRGVTVNGLQGHAISDPRALREAMHNEIVMEGVQADEKDLSSRDAERAAQYAANLAANAPFSNGAITDEDISQANGQAAAAQRRFEQSYAMPMFQSHLPGQFAPDASSSADAFEVIFRLSAEEQLANAFGLLRILVRDPANPEQPLQVLKPFSLRQVGPEPRKITLLQTGLPAGFTVDSFQVHIYSRGQEVPTNLSANRVALTIDEAHQFLILRHSQVYRTETIPAQLIPDLVPADVQTWLAKIGSDATVDIAIGRDGRVTKVTAVRANAELSVAEVESRLREVRFLPALVNGSPVDSEGTFGLTEFSH